MAGLERCEPQVSGRTRPSEVMRLTQGTAKMNKSETSDAARASCPVDQVILFALLTVGEMVHEMPPYWSKLL